MSRAQESWEDLCDVIKKTESDRLKNELKNYGIDVDAIKKENTELREKLRQIKSRVRSFAQKLSSE
ncbi:hypothetical protein L6259_00555 [Candidatus Parcubacteria bacterium]|nr:hypothetical protein [Patescibacteria group bacterium]MCG2693764.1 hypothetical protein [Candidatus Parcubacteria bacterium]